TASRRSRNAWNSEQQRKRTGIGHRVTRFIDQVERDDRANAELEDLQDQVEVAYELGRIDDDQRKVGTRIAVPAEDRIDRNLLFARTRRQRVAARNVEHFGIDRRTAAAAKTGSS